VPVIYWIAMKAKGNEQSIVNGARQKKKEKSDPWRVSNPGRFLEKTDDARIYTGAVVQSNSQGASIWSQMVYDY
jgi:hypothetical protein